MSRDPGQWWTEAWSPVTGCTPAGAGCDHCWARAMVRRFPVIHGEGVPWSTVVCHPDRLDKPLHWRKPRVVLVSMLSDLFHEQVPMDFARLVLETAWDCNFDRLPPVREPHHFCFLTKRPRRAVEIIGRYANEVEGYADATGLMLMASVWDQPSTDAACAAFASLPAGVRWGLHVEPMLGAIDIVRACIDATPADHRRDLWPSWVVCGGENGPGARPMDPRWALDLREQCKKAGVPFWFKGGSKFSPEMSNEERSGLESSRETPW